jgi:hypothetical protein
MKRSQKQIEASRLNGAKSRGPVTPAGRLASTGSNWRRHLLARAIVLPNESRERFTELENSLLAEIQPSTPIEMLLVNRMVVSQWRQMRLWGNEKSSIAADPTGLPERASIFETRYDRQFDRALAAIERRRGLKTKVEPATRSKQTEIPPEPTHQTDLPADN